MVVEMFIWFGSEYVNKIDTYFEKGDFIMKLLFFIFVVSLLLVTTLWILVSFICYFTEGKFFGKLVHKTLNRHYPGDNQITCYRNSVMSNCKYCNKRIVKVGKDWFVLEHQNKGGR